ncbi:MAG: hypothetical protein ABI068_16800 [Ktedonobacterales bacterium]
MTTKQSDSSAIVAVTQVAPVALTTFDVELTGPLDMPASLEFFRRNGDDLLDRWDGAHFVRTQRVAHVTVAYVCEPAGSVQRPAMRVSIADPAHQEVIAATVRAAFVQPPAAEYAYLLAHDPLIADLDRRFPGLRPIRQFDLFTALVRSISAQQVNLRWAATTRRRLAEAFGEQHTIGPHVVYSLNPQRLAQAPPAELRALQFTTRKAEYIVAAAQAIASGALSLETLAALPDDAVIARLTALRGIGRWTAEWLLARTLGRPCVVAGDLAVRKVVGRAYLDQPGTPLVSEEAVRQATAHWGASANVAQALLLHSLVAEV